MDEPAMGLRPELFYPQRNFLGIPAEQSSLETARVIIIPVPYDNTTSYKPGTREGPMAIIDASQNMETYDPELGRELYQVGFCTLPEVKVALASPEAMVHRVYQVAQSLLEKGPDRLLVMLGGEHTLSLGMVRAFSEVHPDLWVLHLDAHADMRDEDQGSRYTHATVMRRVVERCPIVQVGVRSLAAEEAQFLAQADRVTCLAAQSPLSEAIAEQVVAKLGPVVYISIDLDVLDPSIMAAVGTPEPGGLGWYDTLGLLRRVASSHRVVGFDIVELCPKEGPVACAYTAAKLTYKLIGYITHPKTNALH